MKCSIAFPPLPLAGAVLLAGVALPAFAQSNATAPAAGAVFAIPVVPVGPGGLPAAQAAPPAPVQVPSGLAEIIKAKFPLAVTRQELGQGWRVLDNGMDQAFYTRGDTHWVAGREYLVAYVPAERDPVTLAEKDYVAQLSGRYVAPPTAEDRFELVLLDLLRLVPRFSNSEPPIRSYKAPVVRDTFDPAGRPETYQQNLSLIYLRRLFQAVENYSGTYLGTMPPMETAFAARQALLPFAENPAIFTQPGTKNAYKANPVFSGQKRVHLKKQGQLVLFYEAEAASDGMRAVLQYNGTVRRVPEKDWAKVKELSRLP